MLVIMSRTAATDLAEFAVGFEPGSLPDEVGQTATLHLLDTIGCGLAAVGRGAMEPATRLVTEQGGVPDATLLGDPARAPAAMAALANGTRCHALDFDDTHEAGICHVSTVLAPAALAVGERQEASGGETLEAFAIGSEVALRVAVAAAEGLYARGFHPTPVCGAFGAAAATARLAGLSVTETANALGIVGSFAAGLLEFLSDGSETKPLHAGWAAQSGVQAALLARAGATGPATVLEGAFGVLASFADVDDAAGVTSDLGTRWETERVAIKAYPMCHFSHSPVAALAELATERRLSPADVAGIVATVPAEGVALVLEPIEGKRAPATVYDAKFSLPYCLAHQLARGDVGLTAFEEEPVADPGLRELAAKVTGDGWRAGGAPSRFAGAVRVETSSGETLERLVTHPPGSPQNPLPPAEVLRKFRANAGLALADEDVDTLADALLELGKAEQVAVVLAPLAAAPAAVG
jgi:2-methylcitrate dehydratase PrpD